MTVKTKTFVIEVRTETQVRVIIPESYGDEDIIKDWESGLWEIPEGIKDIAKYAARMAVLYPGYAHDGIGKLHTTHWKEPDYENNPRQVVAYIEYEDEESEIIEEL